MLLVSRLLLLSAALLPLSTFAAEKSGQLRIDIQVDGQKSWQANGDTGSATISERYTIVHYLKSVGEPDTDNTMAPDFAQRQMATAARVQASVARANGQAAPRAAKTQEEYVAHQKALAAEMQKGQAACKGDMQCLMQLSTRYSQQSAAIQPPGTPTGAAFTGDEEDNARARYQSYIGDTARRPEAQVRINTSMKGAYADVAGMVPWSESQVADSRATDTERSLLTIPQMVYDLDTRSFYLHGIGVPRALGRTVRKDGLHGETVHDRTEIIGTKEALEWVQTQLRKAPASGSRSTVLTPRETSAQGTTQSNIKVRVDWTFVPG